MVITMDKSYLLHLSESKIAYHKNQAKIAYEEKVKIIIELQKIKSEFQRSHENNTKSNRNVWRIQL